MDQSMNLLSAQIQFLETELALIHIPLNLYNYFLQPILALLTPIPSDSNNVTDFRAARSWAYEHPFVNISVTPVECSVVCPRELAIALFEPIRDSLEPALREQCCISLDDYIVIQVYGDGLDPGQRVLELTGPLAMNGISIFFITSYFSDYVLVPLRSHPSVISALEARGFAFEMHADAFVNIASPTSLHHAHVRPSSSSNYFPSPFTSSSMPLGTPPLSAPSSIADLQSHTFATLRRRNIRPEVDLSLRLVQCAGRKEEAHLPTRSSHSGSDFGAPASPSALLLHLGILRCLIASPRPRFLSLTLTDTEPASLLLEQRLLANFASDDGTGRGESVLLGNMEDVLVPITLDLRGLPEESTGIVCGVAGKLVGGTRSRPGTGEGWVGGFGSGGGGGGTGGSVEMSYLSTARAGTVMVAEYELERALKALKGSEETL